MKLYNPLGSDAEPSTAVYAIISVLIVFWMLIVLAINFLPLKFLILALLLVPIAFVARTVWYIFKGK